MKELIHIHCPYGKGHEYALRPKTWCGLDARGGAGLTVIYGGSVKTKMNQIVLKSRTFEYMPCEDCKEKSGSPVANLYILDSIDL